MNEQFDIYDNIYSRGGMLLAAKLRDSVNGTSETNPAWSLPDDNAGLRKYTRSAQELDAMCQIESLYWTAQFVNIILLLIQLCWCVGSIRCTD